MILGPDTVTILSAAAFAIVVLGTGGLLTEVGVWYHSLRKPSWQPPNWLFGPAWTVIAVFTTAAGVLAWKDSPAGRPLMLTLFVINGLLNVGWTLLFFKLHRPDWAVIEVVLLWLSVLALTLALWPMSATAGWLMLPYLAWVFFAGLLNRTVVQLNKPFRLAGRENNRHLGDYS
jgi:tryptophan-rich sensory protein